MCSYSNKNGGKLFSPKRLLGKNRKNRVFVRQIKF
nr:MAG TPA: hypothetical protein [Inoviridae sp.]